MSETRHTFVRVFGGYRATLTIRPAPHLNPATPRWLPKMPKDKRDEFAEEYAQWMIDSYRAVAKETGQLCLTGSGDGDNFEGWAIHPNGSIARIRRITMTLT